LPYWSKKVPIKIALPKGRLLDKTASVLQKAGWGLEGYHEKARFYRLKSQKFPDISAKIFHERDIPIQVAIGNYDLGICGLDWVEELLVKYPSSALVKVKNLGYGQSTLYMIASQMERPSNVAQLKAKGGIIRIASEYPNLAESFALKNRLRRFNIFPVWGGAEVYPPENAELALVCGRTEMELNNYGMAAVDKVLDFNAFLIANQRSWESKHLAQMVTSICDNSDQLPSDEVSGTEMVGPKEKSRQYPEAADGIVRLALPDGHQQTPMLNLLNKAGIKVDDYPSTVGNRRPTISLAGVAVKVIRPQDMPLQVANGNFDLAITGRDWLMEHLYQFPSSPAKELLDLKLGKVKIVAVVSQTLPATDVSGLRQLIAGWSEPFRVASEYINIADKYARDNHLGHYRVIPTWGATEAFLPEDADLLIENTQTGQTIARHNLKIVDTLFESTACLIGNTRMKYGSAKGQRVKSIIEMLRAAVEDI
jgi:ATP phosphoribosyltransferase